MMRVKRIANNTLYHFELCTFTTFLSTLVCCLIRTSRFHSFGKVQGQLLVKMPTNWNNLLFDEGFYQVQKKILPLLSSSDLLQLRFVFTSANNPIFWLRCAKMKFPETDERFQCLFDNHLENHPKSLMKLMMMVTLNNGLSYEIAILRFFHRMDLLHAPHHTYKYDWSDFRASKAFVSTMDIFRLKKHSGLLDFDKVSYLNKKDGDKIYFRISKIFPADFYHIFFYQKSKNFCIDVYFWNVKYFLNYIYNSKIYMC